MRWGLVTWVALAATVLGQFNVSSAQDLKSFEGLASEARDTEERQRICTQAFDRFLAPVFEKEPGREVPSEFRTLWQACEGLLFPSTPVMRQLGQARENFNRNFGETSRWSLVQYVGRVRDPKEVASQMLETAVGLARPDGQDGQPPRLSQLSRDPRLD